MDKNFVNVTQACDYMGIKKSTLYSLTSNKKITHYKIGKLLVFKISDLNEFIESKKVTSIDEMVSIHYNKLRKVQAE